MSNDLAAADSTAACCDERSGEMHDNRDELAGEMPGAWLSYDARQCKKLEQFMRRGDDFTPRRDTSCRLRR